MIEVFVVEMSFEEVMKEFEVVVGCLECGDVLFEELINFYNCGDVFKKYCEVKLKEVEEKVVKIMFGVDGVLMGIVLFDVG